MWLLVCGAKFPVDKLKVIITTSYSHDYKHSPADVLLQTMSWLHENHRWNPTAVTHVSSSYFRRAWSDWKNALAMLWANQKRVSLLPTLQSRSLPPIELIDQSGPPHADTLAAPLHSHNHFHNPFQVPPYALSAPLLTPRAHLHAVSVLWERSVLL